MADGTYAAARPHPVADFRGASRWAQPVEPIDNKPPLSMVAVLNDRPAVAAQASFPLTTLVRSDFVLDVQTALETLHGYGGTLPLTGPSVLELPARGTGSIIPRPILFYLGRMLSIAPSAALRIPAADPIAVVAPARSIGDYFLAANVLNPPVIQIFPRDFLAVQCTPRTSTVIRLNRVEYVPIGPIMAAAGFLSAAPFPVPNDTGSTAWATLVNTTGLVSGSTRLGDELSLLYREDAIASSAFASMRHWTWNGRGFSAPRCAAPPGSWSGRDLP